MSAFVHLGATGVALLLTTFIETPVDAQKAELPQANALLKDKVGKDVGTVKLTQTPAGVLLNVVVKGLPAGERAFHIHAVGKCEPPFESAGPHFNPDNEKHGMLTGHGHAGDAIRQRQGFEKRCKKGEAPHGGPGR